MCFLIRGAVLTLTRKSGDLRHVGAQINPCPGVDIYGIIPLSELFLPYNRLPFFP